MIPTISWPTAAVLIAVVACSGALAGMHVISVDWIERTLTAVIGFTVGVAHGIRIGKGAPDGDRR